MGRVITRLWHCTLKTSLFQSQLCRTLTDYVIWQNLPTYVILITFYGSSFYSFSLFFTSPSCSLSFSFLAHCCSLTDCCFCHIATAHCLYHSYDPRNAYVFYLQLFLLFNNKIFTDIAHFLFCSRYKIYIAKPQLLCYIIILHMLLHYFFNFN